MTRPTAAVFCVMLAAALQGHGLASAAGESGDQLDVAQLTARSVQLLLTEGEPGSFTGLEPATVRLTLDGKSVRADVEAAAASAVSRSVMLLLDVSGSMAGERMQAAQTAALAFLDDAPGDVAVGLATFGSEVRIDVPPSADRAVVRAAVSASTARGDTRLHDALTTVAAALPRGASVLLLSDGADDGSQATQAQAAGAVMGAGLALTALDLQGDATVRAALDDLVSRAGGRVVPATSAGAMAAALRSEAARLDSQLRLTAAIPPELRGRAVTAEVTAVAASGTVQVGVLLDIPSQAGSAAAPAPGAEPPRLRVATPPLQQGVVQWGLAAVFLSLLLLVALATGAGRDRVRNERRTMQLMSQYTVHPQDDHADAADLAERSVVARRALHGAGALLRRRGDETALLQLLQAAGSALQPSEWLLLRIGATIGGALLLGLLAGFPGVVVGAGIGLLGPRWWLKRRAAKRRTAFADGLPDALALVVGGLSSGYSFAQALDTVVRDGAEPMSSEIGRALAESRLGIPLERSLDAVADRMESEDLRWVVMAVAVQRDVGGSLAQVLQTVFETMRDRARIRREILTLSAEGRVSAALLVGLPIFMAAYQFLFRRDYMRPMYTEPAGFVMIAVTVVALTLGTLWTRALVKVDV